MSIKVMTDVWSSSKNKGSALLLLLAIADHAHDDGAGAYPSVETLAAKVRMTVRNTQYLIRKLEESGELDVQYGAGPHGSNIYCVKVQDLRGANFAGVKNSVARGEKQRRSGVNPIAPKPSVEPSKNRQGETAQPQAADPTPSPSADTGNQRLSATPKKTRTASTGWPGYEQLPDDWAAYCAAQRPDLDAVAVFEDFRGKSLAKGYTYKDWRQAWQNWVRTTEARPYLLKQRGGPGPRLRLSADDERIKLYADRHGITMEQARADLARQQQAVTV